eukprot:Gregarina_sp_Pseudo_9__281@NODE_1180_length_1808_cov_191_534765_g1106_i0_p1_GENE_NODE_1180_length_1808_cov_191_534765_g1106_i0NODE_1180_length_1808_cov_191_534765_g1106_i0_p1_ORF_typecomplete_len298_score58_04Mito_carr/PF00153_27/24Mito_carr/PF00153_27/1_6_NODE_1180_length_1808_cov_191_534765_g1106_i07481641
MGGPMESYMSKPLTQREEARLSSAGNCITLACFRPLDTYRSAIQESREKGRLHLAALWRGWPKQAFNKVLDDEVFNANIKRVTKFVEETFNYKNPAGTPHGKAAVATAARALTLSIMVPYQQVSDQSKRKVLLSKKHGGGKKALVTLTPFYAGFERSLIKESVFTSSYILLGSYFGNVFAKYRPAIITQIDTHLPERYRSEERKNKIADVAVASLKAAAAGACATLLSQPVDMAGKSIPVSTQITRASRKAFRKGCYNGINTIIVQCLYTQKIHRRLFWNIAAPFEDAHEKIAANKK